MNNLHNTNTYRRRKRVSSRSNQVHHDSLRENIRAVKLIVCIAIFALSAAIKLIFPASLEKVESDVFRVISGDVNYRAAVEAIGRGIGGETDMKEALSDAWVYAFVQDGGATPAKAAGVQDVEAEEV